MVGKKINFKVDAILISALICAVMFYSGVFKVKKNSSFISLFDFEKITAVEGKIASNPVKNTKNKKYSCDFSVEKCYVSSNFFSTCSGSIRVMLDECDVESYYPGKLYSKSKSGGLLCEQGARLRIEGAFKKSSLNGELVFVAKSANQLLWGDSLFQRILHFRALSRLQFRRIMYFWGSAGGLFLALLSGIREYTENSLADAFKNAGLSHILALSGMHLSLFSNISSKFSSCFFGKKVGILFQFFAILLFVWFAGFSPSLFRAFLCNLIIIFCTLANVKNIKMFNVLSLSFLIHICIFPQDMTKLAFELSYGALLGILLFGEFFTFLSVNKMPSVIASSFGSSVGAQGITAPITLKILGTFSPIGIISTVVVSPLVTFFIYAGLLLMILCFFCPPIAPAAAFFMKIVYNVIEKTVTVFSLCPVVKV